MDKTPSASLPDSGSLPTDSGLLALALVARLHGLATDPDTLTHRHGSGGRPLDAAALVRAARDTGLRVRLRGADDAGLDTLPLPALAETRAGDWLVLARVSAERVLVHEPGGAQPRIMARAEFRAAWSGRVLLLARRGAGAESARFRHRLVPARGAALPAHPRRGAAGLGGAAAVGARHPGVLPGRGRQGAGAQGAGHAAGAGRRLRGGVGVRGAARRAAHLAARAHHQPHRRHARRAAVRAPAGAAAALLRGAPRRRDRRARARARNAARLRHRLGAHAC